MNFFTGIAQISIIPILTALNAISVPVIPATYQYTIVYPELDDNYLRSWLEGKNFIDSSEQIEQFYSKCVENNDSGLVYPGRDYKISWNRSHLVIGNNNIDDAFRYITYFTTHQEIAFEYKYQDFLLSKRFSLETLDGCDPDTAIEQCNQIVKRFGLQYESIDCYSITYDTIIKTIEDPMYKYAAITPDNTNWCEDDGAYLLVYRNGVLDDIPENNGFHFDNIPIYETNPTYAIYSPKYGLVTMELSLRPILTEKKLQPIITKENASELARQKLLEDFKTADILQLTSCELNYLQDDVNASNTYYSPYWRTTWTVTDKILEPEYTNGILKKGENGLLTLEIIIPALEE